MEGDGAGGVTVVGWGSAAGPVVAGTGAVGGKMGVMRRG